RNESIDPDAIEDVIAGAANQAGEDNRDVARMSALLAGLPISVGGNTVNRLCASGLQAIMDAARSIMCNEGMLYIAGGVESMTRAPFVTAKADG
ncbi:3-oxoadipyl-CoA thiolase, partial [Shewanella algae]